MFDRIFDFLESVWEWLLPFTVIDAYEMGVVLRFGKYNRTIGPGLRFMWPLGIENCKYDTVVRQTSFLEVQSVESFDNKPITIRAILVYTIDDIRKFLLDIDDGETDVQNMCYGVITDFVEGTPWQKIKGAEFNSSVEQECRTICNDYCGVNLIHVKWSDKAPARNFRLWND